MKGDLLKVKLNPNCVRDILLEIEKQPFQSELSISELRETLHQYDKEEISYCCLKLYEADYIDILTVDVLRSSTPGIISINDITFNGHEFLNNIRSDSVWNNVKAIGTQIGSNSISALSQIATGVITAIIKNQLGI